MTYVNKTLDIPVNGRFMVCDKCHVEILTSCDWEEMAMPDTQGWFVYTMQGMPQADWKHLCPPCGNEAMKEFVDGK